MAKIDSNSKNRGPVAGLNYRLLFGAMVCPLGIEAEQHVAVPTGAQAAH